MLRMLIDKQLLVFRGGNWILNSELDLELEVPENLQDLILARFDRLTLTQRILLQTASVIGREFSTELLTQVLENREEPSLEHLLGGLEEKAFILRGAAPSYHGYRFRHVLTSDAVYRTLLRRERTSLHGKVANAIEQVYSDQLEDQVEVLAGHYLRSDYLDKALYYLILAGRKSAREYANQQALRYFEQARHLLADVEHSSEQAWQVWLGLGDVLVFVGQYEEARSCYREILDSNLPVVEGDSLSGLHEVYRKIAITYERQGDFDKALQQLQMAGEALQASANASPVAEAQILNDRGWILFLRGNFQESRSALQSALELATGSEDLGVVASINNRLGAVAYQLREYKQAASSVRDSLEIRKFLGDISGEARLYNNLGLLGLMSGDLQEAQANFYQSITLLEKVGDTEGIALANINLGLVKYDLGDYESAGRHLENSLSISEKIGHRFYLGLASMYLGRLQTSSGEFGMAEDALQESQEIFEELGAQDNLVDAQYYLAENYLAWGKIEQAIEWGESAYDNLISEKTKLALDSVQSGRVNRLLGSIARRQKDLESSQQYLQESFEIFQVASEKLELARTAYAMGLLALDREQPEQAYSSFARAKEIFLEVGAQKELERLQYYLVATVA
jgi:tetratricopeptide (TPR) repeat protein